ncbi:probable LRR receptor-like serine/threonine-protein kinase At1g51810 [Camellia sinensis]|uniref:probable LRR receptor-like serine/threonine-protein kinase At1g51810 n=1 Tax=Camellia sinensis TaxID=4442 RepID=UPI001036D447|nr:probable LRR receptor-like serine/threonine-protein kinase At1g51810 [Camellia sinensis]
MTVIMVWYVTQSSINYPILMVYHPCQTFLSHSQSLFLSPLSTSLFLSLSPNFPIHPFCYPFPTMSVPIFLLWLVSIPLIVQAGSAPPRGFLLNCGSDNELQEGGLKYITDDGFITVGNKTTLKQPGLHMVLSTLRYFPDNAAHKYCYVFPVIKGGKFLVKTTYYYGGYDGEKEPPVFDQFIDGTKWSMVNTTEDYANGLSSFYEIIVTAHGKTLSVCLARNQHTVSSPFISALELQHLEDSLYNSTDFDNYALSTVARNCFGCEAQIISFPDDQFNRFWTPFKDSNPVVTSRSNITASEFWNIPPAKALSAAITTSRGKKLTVKWPPFLLPKTNYYIALYFQDNRNPSPYSWRVFSVAVNGMDFYTDINVTTKGVSVYTAHWPLAGQTEIVLTPHSDSPVGPLINAGEVFQIFPLGKRTLTRDVIAIEDLARGFDNPPGDWHGDPCLPEKHSWTGVTCSIGAKYARIVSLNLTNVGLIGELAESVDHLTALTSLTLEGNKLSGSIPKMSSLKSLEILHLDGNQFQGEIPESLGQLTHLRSLQLQNNYLNGSVPNSLLKKNGLNLQITPGNQLATAH